MPGNSFGKHFVLTTFGESHGKALGCVVDGCPAGFELNEALIQPFLDKRKPGQSRYTSQRREQDRVEIVSGIFEGKTTGAPIALIFRNHDNRLSDYEYLKDVFRPGHADYTYYRKYGIRDYQGGGRASARETIARVAAGGIAQLYLKAHWGISIIGFLQQMGHIVLDFVDKSHIADNAFFCANNYQPDQLKQLIDALRRDGDSIGARVGVIAQGVPIGLGEPVFDKLGAVIAHAMMSIPAAKGVEIGDGFAVIEQLGSQHRDEMNLSGFLSNHAGGMLGGISTGESISVSVAFKPASSITKPAKTITIQGEETKVRVKGRHDPCVGIRAVPVAEAMLALVLIDFCLGSNLRSLRGEL